MMTNQSYDGSSRSGFMMMMVIMLVVMTITGPSTVTAAFVPGSFVAGEATCVGCFRSALDCDWTGATPLLTPTLTPSDDAGCAALCLVNTQCTHYTFTSLAPGFGFCSLKSDTTALVPVNAVPGGNGSSCGWLFGRSLGTSPPGFAAAAAKSSSSNNAFMMSAELSELAKLQNPEMRAAALRQKFKRQISSHSQ